MFERELYNGSIYSLETEELRGRVYCDILGVLGKYKSNLSVDNNGTKELISGEMIPF